MKKIGTLPYVRVFDYTIKTPFFSESLERVFNPELFLGAELAHHMSVDYESLRVQGDIAWEEF